MGEACLQSKMGTEVEHASGDIQTTVTTPSSTASTSGPKMSMFAKKSGFVIPKNKLSGSLVPVYRGTKKGDADLTNEEATNQAQRKTKWGPDLTLDTTVRKGRALAYQTRINQISQQLTLGALELEDNEGSLSTSEFQYGKTSDHQLSKEESEQLELERREIIGEILKLNPTYKAPADYKPLLKEAKVPIPIKEYPGYNFIGLVFGLASDTQKRLEKETGAKIQVYGTKADTGGKVELTPTDGKEIENAYEDLYVHVSADTFEKIDAAVALIELLLTRVSVNPVSSSTTSTADYVDNVNTHPSQSMSNSIIAPALMNHGTAQPYAGSFPPSQGQFPQFPQYPQAWFPAGPTHTPTYPQSGFVTPANSSAPLLSNTVQVSSSPFNPTNMPSLFGPRPVIAASFSPVLQNPSVVPSRPHALQPPYMQQAPPLGQTGGPRNTAVPILHSVTAQLSLTGPPYNVRPVISTSPQSASLAAFSDKPRPSAGESTRWLPSPVSTSASQGLTYIMPMNPPVVPSHGHNAMASQNMVVSGAPLVNIPNNMISPLSGPSQPAGAVASQQSRGGFSPLLPPAASESAPSSIGPAQPAMPQVAMRAPSSSGIPGTPPMPFMVQSSASLPQPGIPSSFSGSAHNFDSIKPLSAAIPRPQQPSSSDFTFQPHRPPNAASQVWQSSQPAHHNVRPPVQAGQASLAPQSPLLRPVQGFPRPQVSHPINQPRAQIPTNFAGGPTVPLGPPRHPIMPGHNTVASVTVPHMQPRNFVPPHPINNSSGPFPPRPGSQMHIQENHLPGATRPQRFPTPHQHFGNHPGRPFSSSSGGQQIYDPFSPTSVSFNPQMGGNATRVHSESDPEYEDLMASVGVK
ncbi:hypothetical protein Pfo_007545 [Paulownia fortunei]|nr:hypothetical protein Pfo_007545 [Paulownia fortunei]